VECHDQNVRRKEDVIEREVYIANKDFYSTSSCGSYSGTRCEVTVTTSEGTRAVSGTWEGCVDHGKVWVLVAHRISPIAGI
jgi:hypothetical protein